MTTPIITKEELQSQENLPLVDSTEIDKAFASAKDFREVWERITAPLEDIINKTAKIIDADPIMSVQDELAIVNKDVQSVYSEIMNTDWTVMKFLKWIPGVWGLVWKLDNKFDEAVFNMKGIQWKIELIFSWFDQAYNSINKSIDLQMGFLEWIDKNLDLVEDYRDYIANKINEYDQKLDEITDEKEKQKITLFLNNVEFFKNNLDVLIWNLDMARKRLLMRLDSANKLSLAMNSSRPIFKVLLSTALIETSSQKAIDASMAAMEIMGQTIDKMSSDLTDKAIESNRRAAEVSSNPVLSTEVFIKNVEKLKNHFDEIEAFRNKLAEDSQAEQQAFLEASKDLEDFNVLTAEENKKLEQMLKQVD